jgi:hypothetical protein
MPQGFMRQDVADPYGFPHFGHCALLGSILRGCTVVIALACSSSAAVGSKPLALSLASLALRSRTLSFAFQKCVIGSPISVQIACCSVLAKFPNWADCF